jgi:hypothetical protein
MHRMHAVRSRYPETVERGTKVLGISTRQMKRLQHKMRTAGPGVADARPRGSIGKRRLSRRTPVYDMIDGWKAGILKSGA